MTSFAGSIGIIGIALILAVSQGMTSYIDALQEDTLSSYPLTIEATYMDLGTLMETFMGTAESGYEHEKDAVYSKSVVYDMINSLSNMETTENDLESFKSYIEAERLKNEEENGLSQVINGVQYTYDMDMLIYTENVDGNIILSDAEELLRGIIMEYMGMDVSSMLDISESYGFSSDSSMMSMFGGGMSIKLWQEMLPAL